MALDRECQGVHWKPHCPEPLSSPLQRLLMRT